MSHQLIQFGCHCVSIQEPGFCCFAEKNVQIRRWADNCIVLNSRLRLRAVPSGYPTRYPVFLSIPDLTRFSFGNYRVAGNPKHQVLPDISGQPEVSGTTRSFGYYPIIRVSPVRGKQYHHQVLFFGNHKKDPRVQKKCKICHFNVKYDCGTPLNLTIIV